MCIRDREGTGDHVDIVVYFHFAVLDGKGLLEDHGVLIGGIGIPAERKVPQAVGNVFSLVSLDALQDMRVMADHQIRAFVDSQVGQGAVYKRQALQIYWHRS